MSVGARGVDPRVPVWRAEEVPTVRAYLSSAAAALRLLSAVTLALASLALPSFMAPPAEAATSNVTIADYNYDPATINISVGDTVHWTNSGKEAHTVTSEGGVWDSGKIEAGASFDLVFSTAGTYNYYCTIHPRMRGRVVVGSGGAT